MIKSILKLKHSRVLLLLFSIIFAYLLFKSRNYQPFHNLLLSFGYLGAFFAGLLYTYGFTAAPATAILLILAKEQNIILAGFIAGLGALIGDLTIFKFIRFVFQDEFKKLSKQRIFNHSKNKIIKKLKKYIIIILAGFIISSPLPDEIGVSLLAGATPISTKIFSIFSYIFNTIGIFIILIIGSMI